MWTVSGDYALEFKPDLAAFARSRYVALYDGIKQGAFAKIFRQGSIFHVSGEKNLSPWHGAPLMQLAQLCIEFAVSAGITAEREGVATIRRKACEDILEMDFARLQETLTGRLKLALFKEVLNGKEPATAR